MRASITSLLLATLTLGGCQDATLQTAPGAAPPTRVDARIEVVDAGGDAVSIVQFGQASTGSFVDREVIVRSVGTDTLQLQDLTVDAPGVTLSSDGTQLLVPGEESVLTLRWEPLVDGLLDGTLAIASSDRQSPIVSVDLRGDGLGPKLTLDPTSFDFGDLEIGCASELDLDLQNTGRAPLTISAVELDVLTGGDEVSMGALVLPLTLQPGETATLTLDYAPGDVAPDASELRVISDDPSAPAAGRSAVQFGIGHYGDTNTDEFTQGGLGLTDIVWVVDNSGSMGDEQATLAANFPAFVPILVESGTDYKLAATTTDAGDNGVFVGATPVVTPSTPDPSATFAANVSLGTTGSGYEQAMLGAWNALNPSNNANPGFLRDNAGLRIILVTDAVDFSTDAGMPFQTPEGYVQAFQGLKDDPSSVIVSGIFGGLTGCNGPGGSAQGSTNVNTAVTLTGGVSASICDANWVASLTALAWLSTTINDTFPLSEPAIEDTIEVQMNGAYVPTGWFYDPALNAVIFDGGLIPDEGDDLRINYGIQAVCEG